MKIDNSQVKTFFECGLKWQERYEYNLEPRVRSGDALSFGTRMHQLLECRYLQMRGEQREYPAPEDATLEAEAQLTFAAYEANYPEEPFEVVGVEQYFEVKLPCDACHDEGCGQAFVDTHHTYCGEFDAIVRMKNSGRLWLLETKTEARGGKDNLPEGWREKSQVGLYLWAAEQVYNEPFEGILLNIITRQSPKGQERPTFRRDNLVRTASQQRAAVANVIWVADRIEECQRTGFFPSNRNNCVSRWGWSCEYLPLHGEGERSEQLVQIKFKPAERYLSGL